MELACVCTCVCMCVCFPPHPPKVLNTSLRVLSIYIYKTKVLNREVAYWTPLHSNRWVQTPFAALFLSNLGLAEGLQQRKEMGREAVCCQRGGDLEYTINVHTLPQPTSQRELNICSERDSNARCVPQLQARQSCPSQRNKKCLILYLGVVIQEIYIYIYWWPMGLSPFSKSYRQSRRMRTNNKINL